MASGADVSQRWCRCTGPIRQHTSAYVSLHQHTSAYILTVASHPRLILHSGSKALLRLYLGSIKVLTCYSEWLKVLNSSVKYIYTCHPVTEHAGRSLLEEVEYQE